MKVNKVVFIDGKVLYKFFFKFLIIKYIDCFLEKIFVLENFLFLLY